MKQNDETVKVAELARRWNVSNRQMGVLTEKGILVRGPGGVLAWASTAKYLAHLRESAAGRSAITTSDERKRVLTEQADKLAFQNSIARSEYWRVDEVMEVWRTGFRGISARLLAIPDRLRSRLPHLTNHDTHEIDAEIRVVLKEIKDSHDPERGFPPVETDEAHA